MTVVAAPTLFGRQLAAGWAVVAGVLATTFTDEVIQVNLALQYGSVSVAHMATILIAGMLGSVSTAFYSLRLYSLLPTGLVILLGNVVGAAVLACYVVLPGFWQAVAVSTVAGIAMTLTGSGLAPYMSAAFPGVATSTVSSIVETARNTGVLVGPAAAGFAAGLLGGRAVASIAAVAMVAGSLVVATAVVVVGRRVIEPVTVPGRRFRPEDVREFFGLVGAWPFFVAVLAGVAALVTLNAVLVSFAQQDVHLTTGEFGCAITCLSVGLVVGPGLARIAFKRDHSRVGVGGWTATMALSILLLVLTAEVWTVLALLFVMGVCNGVRNAELRTVIFDAIPRDSMSRLFPVYSALLQAAALTGFVVTLAASSLLSRAAIIIVGSLLALATGIVIVVSGNDKRTGGIRESSA
ncbi:MFS transporter [Nocardia sp. CA2R105]|uniref:MFS transporter n=1 Tax=Nocardia coffeae TaxID=2873381 RepID=UPI001CA753BD|nr:MFS transporter [Nocardia coffeae]MBY8855710.1 MFS transporter [Nocardia coffeae]